MKFNPKLVSQLREIRENQFVSVSNAFPCIKLEASDFDLAIEIVQKYTSTIKRGEDLLKKYEGYKKSFLEGSFNKRWFDFLRDLVRDCTYKKRWDKKQEIEKQVQEKFGGWGQYDDNFFGVMRILRKFEKYQESLIFMEMGFKELNSIDLDNVEEIIGDGSINPIEK